MREIKEVRVKMGIEENCDEKKKKKKEGTRGRRKKRDAQMWKGVKTCVRKKIKKRRTHITV